METLKIGQRFPAMEVRTTDGVALRLPDAFEGNISVIVFYRGHW